MKTLEQLKIKVEKEFYLMFVIFNSSTGESQGIKNLESPDQILNFIYTQISLAYEEGRKDEANRWINQKANEHDKRIIIQAIEDALSKVPKKVSERWGSAQNAGRISLSRETF